MRVIIIFAFPLSYYHLARGITQVYLLYFFVFLYFTQAAGGEPSHSPMLSTSPKTSGAMISPSMHGPNQQFIPPHHQQQLHPTPRSPTSPHQLATHLVAGHHASSSSEIHGVPNVPVSPAHSPQGLSNSLSSSHYDEINRILREAHFNRVSRINGVELRPDELHL